MSRLIKWLPLSFIFAIGLFLRLFQLGIHPLNLNRDELAVGYNAYSLINTDHDEHGLGPWPIVFKSFDDYKLPGLVYLSYWPIKWFGLNGFSVRLPNAIIGSGLIIIVYFLAKEIFGNKKSAFIASLFIAFSYWHIYNSRSVYEPISALSFSALSYLFLLWSRRRPFWLLFSVLATVVSFYFYNSPLIIIPLIIVSYLVWNHHYYKQHWPWVVSSLVILLASIIIFFRLTAPVNQAKIQTTLFSQSKIAELINLNTHYLHVSGLPLPIARAFSNKPITLFFTLVKNYLSTFNPVYLFITGDNNPWHNLENIGLGNLNLVLLPLFLIGIYQLIRYRPKTINYKFLLLLFLISPLPNIISLNVPVTNRLMDFHLCLELISVYGFLALTKRIKRLILIGYFYLVIYFLICFWFIYPYKLSPLWENGVKSLMQGLSSIINDYDHIYITPNLEYGYIYFVFYTQYDPGLFQSQAEWVNDPLARVVSLNSGKIIFDMVNFNEISERHQPGEKILLIKRDPMIISDNPVIVVNDIDGKVIWQAEAFIVPDQTKL